MSASPNTNPVATSNTYEYSACSFPKDLWTSPDVDYGNNYCVFFINVRGNSLLAQNNNNITKNVNGQPITSGGVSQQGKTGMRLSGPAAGTNSSEIKRTSTAICLYMPSNIMMEHNVEWEEVNLGYLGGAGMLKGGSPSFEETAKQGGVMGVEGLGSITNIAGKVLALTGKSPGIAAGLSTASGYTPDAGIIKNLASAAFGQSINTHKEMLFKGVNFRKFTLDFELYPKDAAEQENAARIIDLFRFHMHPELADQNSTARFFLYPSEFDISFYHGDALNKYMFVLSSSALIRVSVNYTQLGIFVSHDSGAPVGLRLSLDFNELEILTKNRLAELEFNRTEFSGLVPEASAYTAK